MDYDFREFDFCFWKEAVRAPLGSVAVRVIAILLNRDFEGAVLLLCALSAGFRSGQAEAPVPQLSSNRAGDFGADGLQFGH